jgi:2-oxoisovalerate dehydrogenase E1 component
LNIASVWELPVMFVIENNGYGLSTPTNEQYRCENWLTKGKDMEWKVILRREQSLEVYNLLSEKKTP